VYSQWKVRQETCKNPAVFTSAVCVNPAVLNLF
jgi:hypothetical protein